MLNRDQLHFSEEIQAALSHKRPVVAFDTTVLASEIPQSASFDFALEIEKIIRDSGAIPAMMAIFEGQIKVGLNQDELRRICERKGILKAGERDLPILLSRKLSATTTVSASIAIAEAASIPVFITSGLGGVGPFAVSELDVSADLVALSKYRCMVVCSGTKAFLDVGATLEFLETQCVPVVVLGTLQFPLFYTRSSNYKVDWVAWTADEAAQFLTAKQNLGMAGGMVLGVPIAEHDEIPLDLVQGAMQRALEQAKMDGISGKAITPYVLAAIDRETQGKTAVAIQALVRNNAHIGAAIGAALARD